MSVEETFGNLFKPEMKSSGRKLVAQEKVSLSSHSDSQVQAYIRVAPPFRVTLSAEDIGSTSFTAECSCPVAKKSRFCKHVWATLLLTEEKAPDFLDGKTDINKVELDANPETPAKPSYQETANQRASEYRKEQYQKQKARVKEKKNAQKNTQLTPEASYPEAVESSLRYFSDNGFPMPSGPASDVLAEAKRKLSRVFHPDKGGSHEEIVELNRNCEVLLEYLGD